MYTLEMKSIELTKGKVTFVDDEDYPIVSKYKWHLGVKYACRTSKKITMQSMLLEVPKGYVIDHINGNCLDNRRDNLRVCSHSQNCQNRKKSPGTLYPYKGIFRAKRLKTKPWGAQIQFRIEGEKRRKFLGQFTSMEEAARAYDVAATKLFGEFAHLNGI